MATNKKNRALLAFVKNTAVFLTVCVLCATVGYYVLMTKPASSATVKEDPQTRAGMPVTVRTVSPDTYPSTISGLGEVAPLNQTAIKAQVDGKVVFLSKGLQAGNSVKRGDLLVRIEKSPYELQVAEATSRVAAAKVSLLREEREFREAKKNWARSGIKGEPGSPLVLREPQLAAAQAELTAAQAALSHAQTQLGYTEIRAPFDGVVVHRTVNPGDTMFSGGEVAVVFSKNIVEVGVNLDARQWAMLPKPFHTAKARLFDPEQQASWEATVVRESRSLKRDSRLRTLFLQVERPLSQDPPLLPGTFVKVEITGTDFDELLCIPESAMTKQGIVWMVDADNRLMPYATSPVFHGEGEVYIRASKNLDSVARVAIAPNSSFTNGLLVQPLEEKGA